MSFVTEPRLNLSNILSASSIFIPKPLAFQQCLTYSIIMPAQHSKAKIKGASDPLSELLHVEKTNDDESIVDLKVSNPLHRIASILEQIKNKQSTTVSLRFTIPLIALPIVILIAFQLGKVQTGCSPQFLTKTGVIKTISQDIPQENPNPFEFLYSWIPGAPKYDPSKNLILKNQTLLIGENGEVTTVNSNNSQEIDGYEGRQVLVAGEYSSCTSEITIPSAVNITPE